MDTPDANKDNKDDEGTVMHELNSISEEFHLSHCAQDGGLLDIAMSDAASNEEASTNVGLVPAAIMAPANIPVVPAPAGPSTGAGASSTGAGALVLGAKQRSSRKRVQFQVSDILGQCVCGEKVANEEQDAAARCTRAGCETVWVSCFVSGESQNTKSLSVS